MMLLAYDIANTASCQVGEWRAQTPAPLWREASAWISSVAAQFSQIQKLQPNWDSYGAMPITRRAVDAMIELLGSVMNPNAPAPTLVPSARGHLQAEWHMKGIDLEVEAIDPTHIEVDYRGPGGPWSETLGVDLVRLVAAINKLSAP